MQIVDGVQHCVRASRVLGADRLDTRVGPLVIEVVKPMTQLRIRVDHEALKADLLFEARAKPIEEPRFTRQLGPAAVMDLTRFTQHGGYSGTLTIEGRRFEASPLRTRGSRDRSWGIRGVGEREPAGVPDSRPPQFFWLWSPVNFEDYCTHFDVMENADGARWHQFGAAVRAELGAQNRADAIGQLEGQLHPGTRHARHAEIILRSASGSEHRVELSRYTTSICKGSVTCIQSGGMACTWAPTARLMNRSGYRKPTSEVRSFSISRPCRVRGSANAKGWEFWRC